MVVMTERLKSALQRGARLWARRPEFAEVDGQLDHDRLNALAALIANGGGVFGATIVQPADFDSEPHEALQESIADLAKLMHGTAEQMLEVTKQIVAVRKPKEPAAPKISNTLLDRLLCMIDPEFPNRKAHDRIEMMCGLEAALLSLTTQEFIELERAAEHGR